MKTLLKWLAGMIVGLAVLVILAVVLLPTVINPNDYREQLRSVAMENTGYDLHLNGDISWSLFPWLGLNVTDIQVDDIHSQPLATLNRADIHVALLPLMLHKRIDMEALVLDGLTLNLTRDDKGKPNWIESEANTGTATVPGQTEPPEKPASSKSLALNIASIDISQITLNYQDERTGQVMEIRNAHLQTDHIKAGEFFNLTSGFSLESSNPPLQVTVALDTELMLNLNNGDMEASQLHLTITPENNRNPETLKITANLRADKTRLDGSIALKPVNLRQLLQQLGMPLPGMGSQKALTNVSLTATLTATDNRASLHGLKMSVDGFKLSGKLAVTDVSRQSLRFTLKGNNLLLDDYLPVAATKQSATTEAPAVTQDNPVKKTRRAVVNAPVIPVEMLKPLNVEGKLSLSTLTAKGFRFDKPTLSIKADNGVVTLTKLNAGFYDGVIDAKGKIDVNGVQPQLSLKSSMQDIDLKALSVAMPDLQSVTGKANASIRLLTTGLTEPELIKRLNGVIKLNAENGILHGINLNKTVCSGIAKIRKKSITRDDWPDETRFTELKGTFNISEGVATNKDLCASMSQLNLCGVGTINLVRKNLDYQLGITVTGSTAEEDEPACQINKKYADITWPVRCSGKFDGKNLCGIDEQRLGQLTASVAEQELQGKLTEKLDEKLRREFGDQLGEQLGDKLINLFQ